MKTQTDRTLEATSARSQRSYKTARRKIRSETGETSTASSLPLSLYLSPSFSLSLFLSFSLSNYEMSSVIFPWLRPLSRCGGHVTEGFV